MKLFWQIFYKLQLGDQYAATVDATKRTKGYITAATKGNTASFYNLSGEQIRGWHKAPFKFNDAHPLIKHYSAKG